MAKKKKEVCQYCQKSFVSLAKHKCRVKEQVEGEKVEDKTETERKIERIEEKKKETIRTLKKGEKDVLSIITQKADVFFEDLVDITKKSRTDIEEILEVLALQSKIKVVRELVNASWTKHIFIVKDYDDEMQVKEIQIDQSDKGFIWKMFSKQPCFFCPFTDRCNEEATDYFNPHHCPWLSDWINASIEGREYLINFDEIQEKLKDY